MVITCIFFSWQYMDFRPNYENWQGPDKRIACTWTKGMTKDESPHSHQPFQYT